MFAFVFCVFLQPRHDLDQAPEIPPVNLLDTQRFPPIEVVKFNYKLATQHRDWLREEANKWPEYGYDYWLMIQEMEWRIHMWDCLWYAERPEEFGTVRALGYLDRLRKGIGYEAYLAGRMPSPSPTLH